MTTETETGRYFAEGYAHLKRVAPPELAHALIGVISHDVGQPGAASRLLRRPSVNAKPSYEIYSYHYAPLLGFHWGLTARMCAATGKRLVPTYGFFRAYQSGDVCTIHSDRPSCEHSLSLALAYGSGVVWDFEIGTRAYSFEEACALKAGPDFGGEPHRAVRLEPGDAILYQGVAYRHGRMTPNPNAWSAHLFLHWVDLDGPYRDWAFDRQVLPQPSGFRFPEPQTV